MGSPPAHVVCPVGWRSGYLGTLVPSDTAPAIAQDVRSFVARCSSRSVASTGTVPKMPPAITRSCTDRRAPPDPAAPSVIGRAPACPPPTAPATVPAAAPRDTRAAPTTTARKAMPEFETLGYEESGGVAWVTLNRPDVMNAFNTTMQRELRSVWRWLRRHDDVRVVVLTGAGDKAFCTGHRPLRGVGRGAPTRSVGRRGPALRRTPTTTPSTSGRARPRSCSTTPARTSAPRPTTCGSRSSRR